MIKYCGWCKELREFEADMENDMETAAHAVCVECSYCPICEEGPENNGIYAPSATSDDIFQE